MGGRRIGEGAAIAGSAALAAMLAERWLSPAAGLAIWPGIAPLLGLLLALADRRSRIALIAAGGIGGLVLAMPAGRMDGPTLLVVLGTVGAALLAFRLTGGKAGRPGLVRGVDGLRALGRAAAVAAVVPAVAALAAAGWRLALACYAANLLVLLLVTPVVPLAVRWLRRLSHRRRDAAAIRSALMLAAGAGVTAFLAVSGDPALCFLLPGAVLWAAVRGGPAEAATVAGIATLGTLAAAAHHIGALASATPLATVLLLGGCFLAGLPLAHRLDGLRRRAAQARALADRLCLVVQNVDDVLFLVDGEGRWTYLNPAWERLSGLPVDRSLGRSWLERVHPDDREALERQAAAVLEDGGSAFRHTLRFQSPGGMRWVELFLHSVPDDAGRPVGGAGSLRDVDERKRLEEHSLTARRAAEQRAREATLLASTDELTGIANRRAFLHQLDREIEAAIDYGWPLAVALFDVDHFKAVNDRFGHAVGDRVLQHISARAVASVRGGDLVGRLGGEEFGILMPGASAAEAAIVAERLRRAVQAAAVDGQALPPVTVSIGIAQREGQEAAESLIAIADRALYRAKDEGRNRIRVAA